MRSWSLEKLLVLALSWGVLGGGMAFGDEEPGEESAGPGPAAAAAASAPATPSKTPAKSQPDHVALLKDAKKEEGLITTYRVEDKLYAELKGGNYSTEYIVLIAIARGIGQDPVLAGMTWGFGDDWVWQFRKVGENVHVVRKNVRFRADKGKPEEVAVGFAFTDSVLFSLPIAAKGPDGGDLVNLTPVFFSDLPQLSMVLEGFAFASNRSTWAHVKGFPHNVELEVAATYASSGRAEIDTVPDSRGVSVNVHYSISAIPKNSYKPRLADDRVGYFITVVKDFSSKNPRDRFVRYVNRWDLQKVESDEKVSPPKDPIKFYLEKTIPYKYRKPIRDGIMEWNKAFDAIGFVNAIEVYQQRDDDESENIDPEDVRYNFFRWITSSAGYAMGPSRVNPYTGQILDADIIFDADFLQYWKDEYETFTESPTASTILRGNPWSDDKRSPSEVAARTITAPDCRLSQGMSFNLALGSMAVAALKPEEAEAERDKLIMQALKEVTMHEVGHTLGLRHNFRASTYLSLKDLNDPEKTKHGGLTSSVMDYAPVNIVPPGDTQGNYYSETIGPYDMWAIEYGYKPLSGGTDGESEKLREIASRSGERALAFADDSDAPYPFPFDSEAPDPRVGRFDLGDDPLAFAKRQNQLVKELLPGLVDRMTKDGDDFTLPRRAFQVLLGTQAMAMEHVARQVGGLHISRSHKGDADADPPFAIIDAKTQQEALEMVREHVFGPKAYDIAPEIYNKLGASRWFHWGINTPTRPDFPVHDVILRWQFRVLRPILASSTLTRIHDLEMKAKPDEDVLTLADLLHSVSQSIFAEVFELPEGPFSNRKPAISSLRRNLQKLYLRRIADLAMAHTQAPDDCQTLAFVELRELNGKIQELLASDKGKALDRYTKAHLEETSQRITKVLDADFLQYSL